MCHVDEGQRLTPPPLPAAAAAAATGPPPAATSRHCSTDLPFEGRSHGMAGATKQSPASCCTIRAASALEHFSYTAAYLQVACRIQVNIQVQSRTYMGLYGRPQTQHHRRGRGGGRVVPSGGAGGAAAVRYNRAHQPWLSRGKSAGTAGTRRVAPLQAASSSKAKAAISRGWSSRSPPARSSIKNPPPAHSTHPGCGCQQSARRKTPPGGRARPRTAAHREPQGAESRTSRLVHKHPVATSGMQVCMQAGPTGTGSSCRPAIMQGSLAS